MLLLNREDIERCIEFPKIIRALEDALRGFACLAPVVPQRSIIEHRKQKAFSLFMPAFLPATQTLGVKVSSFHPGNSAHGLPAVNGALLLIDVDTGRFLAMLDSGALTAIRTSAMSALATDKLCLQRQVNLAVIGAGAQCAAHIRAMAAVRELKQVRIFSRRQASSFSLADRLRAELNVSIEAVCDIEQALASADVVCTTTSHDSSQPLISVNHLSPGVHINAIGGSTVQACEIDPHLLKTAQVYVDNLEGACRESGEISQALARSVIDRNDIRELGSLLLGQSSKDASKSLSYFRSVGHASQDMVVAACLYAVAEAGGIGRRCDYFGT